MLDSSVRLFCAMIAQVIGRDWFVYNRMKTLKLIIDDCARQGDFDDGASGRDALREVKAKKYKTFFFNTSYLIFHIS